jgi:hypothetical protein
LSYASGWASYGGVFGGARYAVSNGHCEVEGSVKVTRFGTIDGQGNSRIATLPAECRPSKQLIFSTNHGGVSQRVDVWPNGEIHMRKTDSTGGYFSLSGINFITNSVTGTGVSFGTGWRDLGGAWGPASYAVRDNLCFVSGLATVTSGSIGESHGSVIATLPTVCRPSKALIFAMNNDDRTQQVRVSTNGNMQLIAHDTKDATGWISLSGISFPVGLSAVEYHHITYADGWTDFPNFGSTSYSIHGNVCAIGGVAKTTSGTIVGRNPNTPNSKGLLFVLPSECRPEKRLIFAIRALTKTQRVDVLPDGKVYLWQAGGEGETWISLANIEFNRAPFCPAGTTCPLSYAS